EQDRLNALLDAGGGLFLKVWNLDEELKARKQRWKKVLLVAAIIALLALLAVPLVAGLALLSFFARRGAAVPAQPEMLTWLGAGAALLLVLGFLTLLAVGVVTFLKLRGTPEPLDALAHTFVGGLLVIVAGPAARVHMKKYEGRYINLGKLDRLPQ
nr:hypothetical protein [Acidobacteriota bacterium]